MDENESKNKRRPNRLQKELPKDSHDISPSQIRPLRAVQAHHEGERAASYIHTIEGSPWKFYDKIYGLRLGDSDVVIVAEDKGISRDVVTVQHFSGAKAEKQLEMIRHIQHKNLVTAHEVYRYDGKYYVIFEHMPLSLQEVAANPYLDESRLAAVVGQIVDCLAYLEERGLQHGQLTCSYILLHPNGNVKLCGQENCTNRTVPGKDIKDLGHVMMELMQGYAKEGHNVGLDDPKRWNIDAVNFLSATTSVTSTSELMKHPFLKRSWRKEKLKGLISLVALWTKPQYEFLGWKN